MNTRGPHDAAEMEECDSGPFAPDLDHTSVGKWRVSAKTVVKILNVIMGSYYIVIVMPGVLISNKRLDEDVKTV